ncbi:MAG: hypothetical protein WBN15_20320 [Polyangiales bacterium]
MPPVLTVADIEYMQACYELVFAAPTRHALIVDTTTIVRVPDATLRRQMKAFEDSRRPIIGEKNIGSAIIIQSAVVRGGYTALRWISPQPAPNRAFPNLREAAAWCVCGITPSFAYFEKIPRASRARTIRSIEPRSFAR